MTPIEIIYHDGHRALSQATTAILNGDGSLVLKLDEQRKVYLFRELRLPPRLGRLPRVIRLPDGGRLETREHEVVEAWLRAQGGEGWRGWLHRLENSTLWILALVLASALLVWGLVGYGLPYAAGKVVEALPPGVDRAISEQALQAMDHQWFQPSTLAPAERRHLRELVRRLEPASHGFGLDLQLRSSEKIGANAFALPGGTLIVTDDLVRLAPDDQELLAVLAHEVGHVVHRHGVRMLLQNSALVLLLTLVTGDPSSIANLGVALPALLMQASYSRDFEREADDYAEAWMQANGIPPGRLGDMLRRLETAARARAGAEAGSDAKGDGGRLLDYFSTHPSTAERIQRLGGGDRTDPP